MRRSDWKRSKGDKERLEKGKDKRSRRDLGKKQKGPGEGLAEG